MLNTRIRRNCGYTTATVVLVLMLATVTAQAQLADTPDLRARLGDGEVELRWGYSSSGALRGFAMRYATDPAAFTGIVPPKWTVIADRDAREHTVSPLANGSRYYFQLRAIGVDSHGFDIESPTTTATIQLPVAPHETVEIPDLELRDRLSSGREPPTQLDLARRTALQANGDEIADLTGLEHLVNVVSLNLQDNQITDLAPLRGLKALGWLHLDNNAITDVSPLGHVTGLTNLSLADNNIVDVSALGNLTELKFLYLQNNQISDVLALGNLTNLTYLHLNNNQITDVSALGELTKLTRLWLQDNRITDVSALRSLLILNKLDLHNNQITDPSALGQFAHLNELYLNNNEIVDTSGLGELAYLYELWLQNNRITDVSGLAGLTRLRHLDLSINAITDVSTLGRLANLLYLALDNNQIADVSALSGLTGVNRLRLSNNKITDISALGHLEASWLWLDNNKIEDVSALGNLPWIRHLWLNNNKIKDVSALSGLARLSTLWLQNNRVMDVSAIENLTHLETLCLANNRIEDVSALANLSLLWLGLAGNAITEVSALGNLPAVRWLNLSANSIRDVSALDNLTGLSTLYLDDNQISDVPMFGGPTPLGSFPQPNSLFLENNQITDVSALYGRFPTGYVLALRGNPLPVDSIDTLRVDGGTILAGHHVPLFPSAGDPTGREGFLRVLNRSKASGVVVVEAIDDADVRGDPVRFSIGAGGAMHFNTADLEGGNAAKGLRNGVGAPTVGNWRLDLFSELDIEALAYIRTPDGFVTSIHDLVPRYQRGCYDPYSRSWPSELRAAIFNPARNLAQRSSLRLINAYGTAWPAPIRGVDDVGTARVAEVDVPVGATTFTAEQLQGLGLGVGVGKQRLVVSAARGLDAMSLLESPGGYLTNLSTAPVADTDGVWRVPFFPAASGPDRQGFVRIANLDAMRAEAAIVAIDDRGLRPQPVVLELGPRQTVHLNSRDLEQGNDAKGLQRGVGSPKSGDWRLGIVSESDILVTSFVRGPGGFLTAMHDVAPADGNVHEVVFFNPARNKRQVSLLRLANDGAAAMVTITGLDDAGNPGGEASASIPSGHAVTFTATQLEEGAAGLTGRLGTGQGKWRLRVAADRPITVMSLLTNPTGHITNLSSRGDGGRRRTDL